MHSTLLLVRHFFGRLFDNEIVSQDGDMRTNMVQALGLLAAPGMFVAFYMLPQRVRFDQPFLRNWMLVGDYYFFVAYSMVVMGFVMVFEWDAIFPDRKDYLVLTPLPLRGTAIFAGKTAALLLFLGLFIVDTNLFGTMLAPLITGPPGTPMALAVRLLLVHVAAVASAGLCVVLACAALQGVLINVLTGAAFRRISPWVQIAVMSVLITVLFLTPLAIAAIRPLVEQQSPVLRWFPPYWFLAWYLDMLPGQPGGPVFHALAPLARQALAVSSIAFAVTYLLGYRRHTRRVLDSVHTAAGGPGAVRMLFDRMVNRWIVRHPLERATFHFITNTVLRSAKQRLFLAAFAGLTLALALPPVVRVGTRPGTSLLMFFPAELFTVPLIFSFFTVTGLRAVFNFPAELRANWIFPVCDAGRCYLHLRAARKWIVAMGLVPMASILLPVEVLFAGWTGGPIHLSFALLLGVILMNLLMVWFRKIPFTCSYFPGKTAMAVMFFLYLAGFSIYAWTMADVERRIAGDPLRLALFYLMGLLALRGLAVMERREFGIDSALIFEDQPDPVVRSLELG